MSPKNLKNINNFEGWGVTLVAYKKNKCICYDRLVWYLNSFNGKDIKGRVYSVLVMFDCVYRSNNCSAKILFRSISLNSRKIIICRSLFIKSSLQLFEQKTPAGMSYCELCEMFQNSCFREYLLCLGITYMLRLLVIAFYFIFCYFPLSYICFPHAFWIILPPALVGNYVEKILTKNLCDNFWRYILDYTNATSPLDLNIKARFQD